MKLLLWCVIALALCRCQRLVSGSDNDTTTVAEIIATTGTLGHLVQALGSRRGLEERESYASCNSLSFGTCNPTDNTKKLYFSSSGSDSGGCTRGSGVYAQTVFGLATLSFSMPNCSDAVGTMITRNFDNHYYTDANGDRVLIYNNTGTVASAALGVEDLTDYAGNVRRGAITLMRTATGDLMSIPGLHRRGYNAAYRFTFWHTIYTTDPLRIYRNLALTSIPSGNLMIAHNRASTLITQSFINVNYQSSCNYPTSGTVFYSLVPSSGTPSSFTVNFSSTCGSVTVDGVATTLAGG